MDEIKSFKELSWQVTEEEYRADKALSYSTLARYEREGFNCLDKLFDRQETASLTFGSAVDSIITGGMQEFGERFLVAEFPSIPDSIIKIVKSMFSMFNTKARTLDKIPDNTIIVETEVQKYQLNWKPETRAKVIKEKGAEYYNLLYIAEDKTILDSETYKDVLNTVNALKHSPATKFYFEINNPFTQIERFYQLKFKGQFNGIWYRNMADLIIVDHEHKQVIPIDLKTSGHPEWDFHESFITWKYDIQARLYWAIIRQNMDNDPIYKDYILQDYRFIVANRKTLCPLVWKYTYTKNTLENLILGKNNQIVLRSPLIIGEELNYYLSSSSQVPIGISTTNSNDIVEWLNK